jgi:membrane protease YdiL (CAAX protease family)
MSIMNRSIIAMRLRTLLRVLLYWIAFVAIYFVAGGFISGFFLRNAHLKGFGNWISGTFAAFFITWTFLKWEKSTFASIGLFWEKGTLLRFFKGLLLGSCIFFLMVLLLYIAGSGHLHRVPWKADGDTLIVCLTLIPLGIMEEVAFRSYPLIRLNQVFGVRVTLLIIALAFALYHVSMGWSFFVAFEGPFVWSFVFGLAAVWSKGIALPAGIHISVNILQNIVGLRLDNGLLFVQCCLLVATIIILELFLRQK